MAYHNHRNANSRPSIYQTVTDRIISNLKAGVIPWEKPWKTPRYAGGPFPRNFYTGKPYRGINILLLWSSEYNSPFWLTFKQAQALKGSVRKGEHGTQIIFYKQLPDHAEKGEEGAGEDERVPFVLCHYTVFNVEQCDGLTLPEISQSAIAPEIDEDELCESIVTGWQSRGPSTQIGSLGRHRPCGQLIAQQKAYTRGSSKIRPCLRNVGRVRPCTPVTARCRSNARPQRNTWGAINEAAYTWAKSEGIDLIQDKSVLFKNDRKLVRNLYAGLKFFAQQQFDALTSQVDRERSNERKPG